MIDLRLLADLLAVGAGDRAFFDQLLRGRAAGVNEELVAAFEQVAGHRASHDAQSDETDLSHGERLQRQ